MQQNQVTASLVWPGLPCWRSTLMLHNLLKGSCKQRTFDARVWTGCFFHMLAVLPYSLMSYMCGIIPTMISKQHILSIKFYLNSISIGTTPRVIYCAWLHSTKSSDTKEIALTSMLIAIKNMLSLLARFSVNILEKHIQQNRQ